MEKHNKILTLLFIHSQLYRKSSFYFSCRLSLLFFLRYMRVIVSIYIHVMPPGYVCVVFMIIFLKAEAIILPEKRKKMVRDPPSAYMCSCVCENRSHISSNIIQFRSIFLDFGISSLAK